jgi:CMP-N,N'-diacetyllegionaminic acid synthase
MSVITIIPARGGSKGIPRKNLVSVYGRPLVCHTIDQSLRASLVDRTIVSTDDSEIAAIAESSGAEVIMRPAKISGDIASSESALVHALEYLRRIEEHEPTFVVFLQCTSPLRRERDIDKSIIQIQEEQADSLLSVSPSHLFLWERVDEVARPVNYDYRRRPRRQEMKPQFRENGSIYIFKPWVLQEYNSRLGGKISLYQMDHPCIDIDSMIDIKIVDFLFAIQD